MNIQSVNMSAQLIESTSVKQFPREGIGDVLKAQVIGKSDSEVILRLENGNVIPASTEIPLDVQVGDSIQLQITDKKDGKIILETLKNSNGEILKNSNTTQIANLLNSLGITPNAKNIDVVNEMMIKQMPLTKENIQTVLKGIAKFADLDIPKAVFMLANNIAFEEKNIEILSQYQEGKIKLGNQIKELINALEQIDDPKILNEVLKKLDNIDKGNISKAVDLLIERVVKNIKPTIENNSVFNQIKTGSEQNSEVPEIIQKAGNKQNNQIIDIPQKTDSKQSNQTTDIIQKNDNKQAERILLKPEQIEQIKKVITEKIDNLTNIIKTNQEENIDIEINEFKKAVLDMPNDELSEAIKQLPKNEKEAIFKLLGTNDDNLNTNNNSELKTREIELKDIEALKKEIKTHFEKHFINPLTDNLKEDLNITESYRELMGKLETIKDSIFAKTDASGIQTLIANTEDNINFMRDLSQYNAFVQIPLNIWGKETNGQLYVLKKEKRKIDPSNASLFLSLDMPNLGLTEVFVKVQGKNVECNFRMENEDLVSLLKENSHKLAQSLNAYGYKFISVNCSLIEKKTGIVEVDKNFENDVRDKKFSIDVKV
ncbi:MAG: flagellar hook-length control protein FliK [Ignavibacteriales bacterium]